jgi:hypothetical protein
MLVTPGECYRPPLRLDTAELRDAYEEGRRGISERDDWSLTLARAAVGRITERLSWRRCAQPNHGSPSRSLACRQ